MYRLFNARWAFRVYGITTALASAGALPPASGAVGSAPASTWAASHATESGGHRSHCPVKIKLPHKGHVVWPGQYLVPRNDQIATVSQATIWQDVSGSIFRTVYAGSARNRPSYGIIVASYDNVCTTQGWTTWYTTSLRTGPLRLVNVIGDVVLVSFRGGHGSFSLSTTRLTVSKKR